MTSSRKKLHSFIEKYKLDGKASSIMKCFYYFFTVNKINTSRTKKGTNNIKTI